MNPRGTALYTEFGWIGVIVAAALIVVATAVLCHIVIKVVRRGLADATEGRVGGTIFDNVIRVVLWWAGIGLLLHLCLDFDLGVIWGALGIGGIALSLGAQTTVSNLLGGFQVSTSHEVAIGDWISVGTTTGRVEDITWRKMIVRDDVGNLYNIPNSILTSTTLEVLTPEAVVRVPLSLDASCDFQAHSEALAQYVACALEAKGMLFEGKTVKPIFQGSDAYGFNVVLKCYVKRGFVLDDVTNVAASAALAFARERDLVPPASAA